MSRHIFSGFIGAILGAFVVGVVPGSPAESAGLIRKDVIVEINGRKVKNSDELRKILKNAPLNKEVPMKLWRNGKETSVRVKIIEGS